MVKHNIEAIFIMVDNKIELNSSEEMYLVIVRQMCEHCEDSPVPIPDIAEGLKLQPVSVNQMIKKLAELDLVVYTPYKGVELTAKGLAIATRILRRRRLWEVFLVKDLGIELDEADALACQLEHVTPDEVVDRLSNFLDNPSVCFHGDPIYPGETNGRIMAPTVPLGDIKVGRPFQVARIDDDEDVQSFLADTGLFPGNRGLIIAVNGNGNIIVETKLGKRVTLTKDVANRIIVMES
jgi:DtxR family Mn-dependent transcriptional regulator